MPPFHPRNSNFCLLPCKAIFVSCHIRNLFVADALYIMVEDKRVSSDIPDKITAYFDMSENGILT